MQRTVKIIGERNSGTNLLEQLIAANFDVNLLKFNPNKFERLILKSIHYDFVQDRLHALHASRDLGWKHGIPTFRNIDRFAQERLNILSITKNPYAFLLSLYRRPYHIKGTLPPTFQDFIRQPWITRRRDNLPIRTLDSPVELWNSKNNAYLNLKKEFPNHVLALKYEDLMSDPFQLMNTLYSSFQWQKKMDHPVLIEQSTKGDQLSFADYQSYYLQDSWRRELTPEVVHEINTKLDHQLLADFNYSLISPESQSSYLKNIEQR